MKNIILVGKQPYSPVAVHNNRSPHWKNYDVQLRVQTKTPFLWFYCALDNDAKDIPKDCKSKNKPVKATENNIGIALFAMPTS